MLIIPLKFPCVFFFLEITKKPILLPNWKQIVEHKATSLTL